MAMSGDEEIIRIYDLRNNFYLKYQLKDSTDFIQSIAFSYNCKYFASASRDLFLRIYD